MPALLCRHLYDSGSGKDHPPCLQCERSESDREGTSQGGQSQRRGPLHFQRRRLWAIKGGLEEDHLEQESLGEHLKKQAAAERGNLSMPPQST